MAAKNTPPHYKKRNALAKPGVPAPRQPNLEEPFFKLWNKVAEVFEKEYSLDLSLQREVPIGQLVDFSDEEMTKHRVDFYCSELKLTIEIHGATHKGRNGAHSSAAGIRRDMHKQRLLVLAGYNHLELDAVMSRDETLIRDTIDCLVWQVMRRGYAKQISNPTHYASWADNAAQARKLTKDRKKIQAYLAASSTPSTLGTTNELKLLLSVKQSSVASVLKEEGYEPFTLRYVQEHNYGGKIVSKPHTKRVWRKLL
jgi:very-short-patch-repair endonuclease